MAAGYLQALAGDRVEVRSAGSSPGQTINPVAAEAMAEEGIDITRNKPQLATPDLMQAADVVVTMGCGDECLYYPGKTYEDWELDDPAGKTIDQVRPIRDDIKRRVQSLIDRLLGESMA